MAAEADLLYELDPVEGTARSFEAIEVASETRFAQFMQDVLFAFMIFYAKFLSTKLEDELNHYAFSIASLLLAILLVWEIEVGLRVRARLQKTQIRVLIILSEWYAFVSHVATVFAVRVAVDDIAEWAEEYSGGNGVTTAVRNGRILILVSSVLYFFFIVAYSSTTSHLDERILGGREGVPNDEEVKHRLLVVRNLHKLINQIAFGIALFLSEKLLPPSGILPLYWVIALALIFYAVDALTNWQPVYRLLQQDRFVATRHFIIAAQRVLAFSISRSTINELQDVLSKEYGAVTRIVVVVSLLLAVGAATQTKRATASTRRRRQILGDVLYGLNIFVAQYIISEFDNYSYATVRVITLLLACASLFIVFAWETALLEMVFTDNGYWRSPYTTVRVWIDILNRLLVFVLIQLLLEVVERRVFDSPDLDWLWHIAVPAAATLFAFFLFQDFARQQSDAILEDENKT